MDLVAGMKVMLMDLQRNLNNAAEQASDSIETFSKGVESEWAEFLNRIETRWENFVDAIEDYVESFYERVSDVSDTIRSCVDENKETAEEMYQQTLESVKACGSNRVEAISQMITSLVVLADNSSDVVEEVLSEVDLCYNTTGNEVIPLAQCLAAVVVDAELKATGFLTQTGYQVWMINLSLAALPAALEVCAGKGLIDAGVDTGTIFGEIASCLASSAYEYFTGNSTMAHKKFNSTLFHTLKL
ncbi:uncharacterized protein LOC121727305 [Aricia agestis]|uniref:uncharacterized protein LOC121727305 n=1 Tax=Aricia agestis TaxID=91739 RepID=UPI001C208F56|nr:uncharacterized protein LOC121727305 [Aricia agestis]